MAKVKKRSRVSRGDNLVESAGVSSRAADYKSGGVIFAQWIARGLGSLAQERATILAATLVIVGVQVFFTSFLLSILSLRRPGV